MTADELFKADHILATLVSRIVQASDPKQVILFGSRARGTAHPGSDYDFLVVKEVIEDGRSLRREIYHALYGLGVAKDVILATPVDIDRFASLHGSILRPAMEDGITVYERAA